jgi:hypothetical protein
MESCYLHVHVYTQVSQGRGSETELEPSTMSDVRMWYRDMTHGLRCLSVCVSRRSFVDVYSGVRWPESPVITACSSTACVDHKINDIKSIIT